MMRKIDKLIFFKVTGKNEARKEIRARKMLLIYMNKNCLSKTPWYRS